MGSEKPLVGIKDVARVANVALATVDRVIHNRTGVSKKTKDKVLKVIEELGYRPNIMASNLAKGKKYTLGVLLPNVSERSSYWGLPIEGIKKAQKELEQFNLSIDFYLYDQTDSVEIRKQILKVINSNIDGLVLTSKFANEIEILLQDCKEKNKPYVFIDSNIQHSNALCSIQQPLYESGQLAGQLFSYCFHKGEILILNLKDVMDSEEILNIKLKGLKDYLNAKRSSISVKRLRITDFDDDNIKQKVSEVLEKNKTIQGIFIPNSKIEKIAKFLESEHLNKYFLIGYDYLKENETYLKSGIIDFLICQRPKEQGYQSVFKLFENIVLRKEVEDKMIMPLDIITVNNYKYY